MHELLVEARLENMDAVLDFVGSHITECSHKIHSQIMIAADEVFSNIARYAYKSETGSAAVRISVGDDITLEFEDCGVAFDPLSGKNPDITLPAEEREIGGLGIFMVKNIMDSVEYRREGNKNILTIKKCLR